MDGDACVASRANAVGKNLWQFRRNYLFEESYTKQLGLFLLFQCIHYVSQLVSTIASLNFIMHPRSGCVLILYVVFWMVHITQLASPHFTLF